MHTALGCGVDAVIRKRALNGHAADIVANVAERSTDTMVSPQRFVTGES